jgi:hypothetical protein
MMNLFILTVLWSFGVSGALAAGWSWYLWPLAILLAFVVIGRLSMGQSSSTGALILLGWVVLGIGQLIQGLIDTFMITYAVPLGLLVSYGAASRVFRLRDAQDFALALGGVLKSAPLVAPVVLIVLFLPALSADVWQVASSLTPASLLVVGVVSVGLQFVVVRLQLGSEVANTVQQRAEHLSDLSERSELTRAQLIAINGNEGSALLEGIPDATVEKSWPTAGEEYAPYLQAAAGGSLQSPLTGSLALTVGAVCLLLTAYVYLLCSAVVPAGLAADWTGMAAPGTELHLLGATVTLHGGAFLNLAALLGLAATATFLSFALVEERFAKALTDALLREPTDRFLVLALPYVRSWEDAIEQGLAARQPPES